MMIMKKETKLIKIQKKSIYTGYYTINDKQCSKYRYTSQNDSACRN